MTIERTYSELLQIPSFEERFVYLRIKGILGRSTFGFDRYLNQRFYASLEWKRIRNYVIVRDNSCDLAIPDRELFGSVRVHHMNPITVEDIELGTDYLLDPEYLICTSLITHNAIHFGDKQNLISLPKERRRGDTTPWLHQVS